MNMQMKVLVVVLHCFLNGFLRHFGSDSITTFVNSLSTGPMPPVLDFLPVVLALGGFGRRCGLWTFSFLLLGFG